MTKKFMFKIFFEKKFIVVYLNNDIFFKQEYIKDKQFTFFYVVHILNKYGMEVTNKKK